MGMDIESVDDGEMLKVSLSDGDRTVWCMVSSYHLVDEKEKQLRDALNRQTSSV